MHDWSFTYTLGMAEHAHGFCGCASDAAPRSASAGAGGEDNPRCAQARTHQLVLGPPPAVLFFSANLCGGSAFGTDEMTADPLCVAVVSQVDKSPGGTPAQWKEGEDFF